MNTSIRRNGAVLSLLLASLPAAADTIDVPAEQPTVEAAIAAALSGDRVRIAAGTFVVGELDFGGKDLRLEGAGVGQTILDANFANRHLVFQNGETNASEVYGITFVNGRSTSAGGSISVSGASPEIYDCEFTGNATLAGTGVGPLGGALYLESSDSFVHDCSFVGNAAADGAQPASGDGLRGGHGGAIAMLASGCRILRCDFDGNTVGAGGDGAASGGDGGAGGRGSAVYIRLWQNEPAAAPSLEQCEFRAGSSGLGGAASDSAFEPGESGNGGLVFIRVRDTDSVLIDRCFFELGTAVGGPNPGAGGGLYLRVDGSDPLGAPAIRVQNSAFRNCSADAASRGGAIAALIDDATIELVNVTMSGCTAGTGGAVSADAAGLSLVNSIAWACGASPLDNAVATYSVVEGGLAGTGNLDVDPLLAADGVRLQEGSPCIEAGDPALANPPVEDLDGDIRALFAMTDIGADEFNAVIHVPGPYASTIAEGVERVAPGGRVLVAPGDYQENGINFGGKDLELIGEQGAELTVINAQQSGRHFTLNSGETAATTIRGFRLRRGEVNGQGGSINIVGANPTLRDLIFSNNEAKNDGGALAIEAATGPILVEGCTFENNSSPGPDNGRGDGGAAWISDSEASFVDCVFALNSSSNANNGLPEPQVKAGHGGAVAIQSGGPVAFEGCRFELNQAGNANQAFPAAPAGNGGAIWAGSDVSSLRVDRCQFSSNSAGVIAAPFQQPTGADGGDIHASSSDLLVRGCYFFEGGAGRGGSISVSGSSSGQRQVLNCTVRGSFSLNLGDAAFITDGATLEIRNSILEGPVNGPIAGPAFNFDVTYSNVEGGYGGVGNFDLPSAFQAASDGYSLSASSPCIDAGSPDLSNLLGTDLDGHLLGCTPIDVGADETGFPAEQVLRVGSIWPNPVAFVEGPSPPILGTTWMPSVDHTSFVVDALVDFAALSVVATEVPFESGSLLVDPGNLLPLETTAPGLQFAIPIPNACSLVGLAVYSQGGSVDSTGVIHLANGLDLVLGDQ